MICHVRDTVKNDNINLWSYEHNFLFLIRVTQYKQQCRWTNEKYSALFYHLCILFLQSIKFKNLKNNDSIQHLILCGIINLYTRSNNKRPIWTNYKNNFL